MSDATICPTCGSPLADLKLTDVEGFLSGKPCPDAFHHRETPVVEPKVRFAAAMRRLVDECRDDGLFVCNEIEAAARLVVEAVADIDCSRDLARCEVMSPSFDEIENNDEWFAAYSKVREEKHAECVASLMKECGL